MTTQNGLDTLIDEFFEENGRLAEVLSEFEFRRGQLVMARAVGGAFVEGRHLMVEAGTGTGKTLAYLLPALFSGKKTVVSTATITLQEQVVNKDIPLIERALGKPVKAVALKGRNNYLCLRRYEQFGRQRVLLTGDGSSHNEELARWASRTKTGDRAELVGLPEGFALWREVSSSSETCLGQKCPRFEGCFVNRAKRAAQLADIVVVNHHLFFIDLMVRDRGGMGIIPRSEAVVLDEAHHIERVALAYFSLSVSPLRIDELTRDLQREMSAEKIADRRIDRATLAVTQASHGFFNTIGARAAEGKSRIYPDFFTEADRERAMGLSARLVLLADAIGMGHIDHEPILAAARRAREIADHLEFIVSMPDREYVFWSETKGGEIFLCAAPIDITGEIRQKLLKKVETIIFTSATLSVMGNFDFFSESVGIGPDVEGITVPGGFDLKRQTLLYIPSELPVPGPGTHNEATIDMIGRLLTISRGRALVLFTSVRNMENAYAVLRDSVGVTMMMQGDAPKGALIREFHEDIASVLFATASFWEGVDIPGEALSMVIIDKLPFDRPTDPLIEAKLEYLKNRDQNPFYHYQIPRAVIALRQGLGRLIRSETDRGVLAVLDSRIRLKSYGRVFLKSLSHYRVTDEIGDVAAFFMD